VIRNDQHVVLVGLMGSGKSTVARLLGERLGRPVVDSDAVIEASTGRTVREIFESDGEDAFRALETSVLQEALASPTPAVIAAAGGAVLRPENRTLLADPSIRVVWLVADPAVLVDRVRSGQHRPLLDGDAAGTLRRMHEAREPLYREVADQVVSSEGRSPNEVVEAILR
jgi:shikimate kinase